MRGRQNAITDVFNNRILVGAITILVVAVAVYLSYIAENGLPFIPTYDINVQVSNADELVKNADVRIGGARVGQVLTITPEPASKTWPRAYAKLGLALDSDLQPLPSDTRYEIRLASVLGGKYLEILPGTEKGPGVPDGGTLTLNSNPRLNHNVPVVDVDTAFDTFGPKTKQAIRSATQEIGNAVAGRGSQINDSIYELDQLIGPAENLLRVFASPSTHLSTFISGAAATTSALAPVAPTISALLSDSATTFAALQNSALGQTIDQLPGTESLGTTVLTNARPVLTEAASIVQALKPGAALLPTALRRLDAILIAAKPPFELAPKLATELQTALVAVQALARDPASTEVFKVLGSNDLATLGASAFDGLGAILRAVAPAQFACNVAGLWVNNFASSLSEGDSTAGWLRFAPVLDLNDGTAGEQFQQSTPSPDLHDNVYPIEDSSQCQAGNEPYTGKQLIGNKGIKTSTTVDNTTPPPGVLARGEEAGLVP
jgi:phospholipid/cholesterol/gamma-HCH transport system substrate-binding protein